MTTRAENIDIKTPMVSVTPNPRTAPEAKKNRSTAARRVVMLASAMALNAFSNPVCRDRPSEESISYSSFALS